MFPLLSGLISGGASLLGSIFSSDQSAQNTQAQIAASRQQQATQNEFTERMSNTAYQRASQDMQKAGLNPAMMFGSGSAASTPSGSGIQAPMPQTTSKMAGLGDAVSKVVTTAINQQTFDKMTEEIANLKTERAKTEAQTETEKWRAPLTRQETLSEVERSQILAAQKELQRLDIPARTVTAKEAKAILEHPDLIRNLAKGSYTGSKVGKTIEPLLDSATAVGVAKRALGKQKVETTRDDGSSSFQERWSTWR